MATAATINPSSQSHGQTPTGPTPPTQRRGPPLVATNTVTTKDGLTVRARIDPTLVGHPFSMKDRFILTITYSLSQM